MLQVCQRHLRPVTNRFGISGTAAIARAAAEKLTATHWSRPPWKCKEPGDWNLLLSKIPWNVIHLQLWKVPILLCWKSTKNKIRALISHLGTHNCTSVYLAYHFAHAQKWPRAVQAYRNDVRSLTLRKLYDCWDATAAKNRDKAHRDTPMRGRYFNEARHSVQHVVIWWVATGFDHFRSSPLYISRSLPLLNILSLCKTSLQQLPKLWLPLSCCHHHYQISSTSEYVQNIQLTVICLRPAKHEFHWRRWSRKPTTNLFPPTSRYAKMLPESKEQTWLRGKEMPQLKLEVLQKSLNHWVESTCTEITEIPTEPKVGQRFL